MTIDPVVPAGGAVSPDKPIEVATSFSSVFKTIIDGYEAVGVVAKYGASFVLLATGMLTLAFALALRAFPFLKAPGIETRPLTTGDLGILVAGSVAFLVAGSGIEILNQLLADKVGERRMRLRIEAAEKSAAVILATTEQAVAVGVTGANRGAAAWQQAGEDVSRVHVGAVTAEDGQARKPIWKE